LCCKAFPPFRPCGAPIRIGIACHWQAFDLKYAALCNTPQGEAWGVAHNLKHRDKSEFVSSGMSFRGHLCPWESVPPTVVASAAGAWQSPPPNAASLPSTTCHFEQAEDAPISAVV